MMCMICMFRRVFEVLMRADGVQSRDNMCAFSIAISWSAPLTYEILIVQLERD